MTLKNKIWLDRLILFCAWMVFFVLTFNQYYACIRFRNNAEAHIAVVSHIESFTNVDGDTGHTAYIKYKVGTTHTVPLDFYYNSLSVGQEIKIYYDPKSPDRIMSQAIINLWLSITLLEVLILLAGLIQYFIRDKKRALSHRQKETNYL